MLSLLTQVPATLEIAHSETPHGSFRCSARPYHVRPACSERNTRPCKEKNRPSAHASLRPALMDQDCQLVLADCGQPSFAPQGLGSNPAGTNQPSTPKRSRPYQIVQS